MAASAKSPPGLVFNFIGIVFTAILYGFYCLLFGMYLRIQFKTRRTSAKGATVLFYAITSIFILCTAYFVVDVIGVQLYITVFVLKEDSLRSTLSWISVAADILYIFIDFISQFILLYRCWIMWRQPLVMAIPCILSLAFLVTAWTTQGFNIKFLMEYQPHPDWYFSTVTAFFFLSLGVNTLVTAMIIYKIITIYHDIREFNTGDASAHGNGQHDLYYPLLSVLIESGLITFVWQLTQSIMYKFADVAFPLVGGCVVMLFGISSTVVLVRVKMGVSYDRNTTRTADSESADLGGRIQHIPFTSRFNHWQTSTNSAK